MSLTTFDRANHGPRLPFLLLGRVEGGRPRRQVHKWALSLIPDDFQNPSQNTHLTSDPALQHNDMEPRKRFHPHTRQEWEGFRPDFTKLYQIEGKKLREVVELLREKGFLAK